MSDANWNYINSLDVPGVLPHFFELKPNAKKKMAEGIKATVVKRSIAIEQLNLLMKVYSHRRILKPTDIEGFKSWANSWYDGFREELTVIFHDGGLYPIEFIIWLRERFKSHVATILSMRRMLAM